MTLGCDHDYVWHRVESLTANNLEMRTACGNTELCRWTHAAHEDQDAEWKVHRKLCKKCFPRE